MEDLQTATLANYENNKATDFNEPMDVDDDTCNKKTADDNVETIGNDISADNNETGNSNKENETPEKTEENGDKQNGEETEDVSMTEDTSVVETENTVIEKDNTTENNESVEPTIENNASTEEVTTSEEVKEAADDVESAKVDSEKETNKVDDETDKAKTDDDKEKIDEDKEKTDNDKDKTDDREVIDNDDKDKEKTDDDKSKTDNEDKAKDKIDNEDKDKEKTDSDDKEKEKTDNVDKDKEKTDDKTITDNDDKEKEKTDNEDKEKEKTDNEDKEKEKTDNEDKEKEKTDNVDKDKTDDKSKTDNDNKEKEKTDGAKSSDVVTIEDESNDTKSDDGVEIIAPIVPIIDVEQEDKKKKKQRKKPKDYGTIDISNETDKSKEGNSLLKKHLSKEGPSTNDDEDFDDDFDPSLLCPEVSMAVDEAPVNTNTDQVRNDGSASPLPYEPVFSTYVDEMTGCEISLNLTAQEQTLRTQLFGMHNPVQFSKVHCTACNVHLGSALDAQKNRFLHPMLKVLVCKECYNFYTSGEFDKDEDGSELYCRWCGQGGQVFCCSKCEFVFCKKCIRNNFGRKKINEINHSDEWNCFRCDQTQLAHLRAHAAELFEYVRNEIGRASTLGDPNFLLTDHSKCCVKKKASPASEIINEEPSTSGPAPKRRRKNSDTDPDYDPIIEEIDPSTKIVPFLPTANSATNNKFNNRTINIPGITVIPPTKKDSNPLKPIIIMPKVSSASSYQVIRPVNSNVRQPAPNPGFTMHRPMNSQTPRNTTPGYIKIIPPAMQNRMPQPRQVRPKGPIQRPNPPLAAKKAANKSKNEWFVKTVRNTAKVNSNLSYTLTQLGVAQANATTVEALAVVHNKLQEVLSTSINSLIQIRKNLRTEFVQDIRNAKFRPKEAEASATSNTASNTVNATPPVTMGTITIPDDDVIVVSNNSPPPLNPLPVISSTVSLTLCEAKESPTPAKKPESPPKKVINPAAGPPPRGFIKVKSFSALQSVPPECITIPDEPATDPLALDDVIITEKEKEKTPEKETEKIPEKEKEKPPEPTPEKPKTLEKKKEKVTAARKSTAPARTPQPEIPKIVLKKSSTTKLFEHLPKVEIKKEPVDKEAIKMTYTKSELDNPDVTLKRILSAKVIIKVEDQIKNQTVKCNGK